MPPSWLTIRRRLAVAWHRRGFPFEACQRRRGCLFIHVPKVAGTAVLEALGKRSGGRHHLPWYVYRAADPLFFDRAFKFAFVRDPWDRAYSAWAYLAAGGNLRDDRVAGAMILSYGDFDSFVVDGLGAGAFRNHPLFLPQSEFILGTDGRLMVDFLGRYETLPNDFALVSKRLGLRKPLTHANPGPENRSSYRDKYATQSAVDTIRTIYRQDVTVLGYTWS